MRRQFNSAGGDGGDVRTIIGALKSVQMMTTVVFSLLYVRRWGLDWAEKAMLVPDASNDELMARIIEDLEFEPIKTKN